MTTENLWHLIAMLSYMMLVVGIGIFFARRANRNPESYFLGGRSLGPWVTAFSAEASDMSGYLLMGLPGLAYWSGLAEAGWTCIGLAAGTWLNWKIVSRRLRRYSESICAITLPDYFSRRFRERKPLLLLLSSLMILVFFCVYAAQCLSACGKLFQHLFGLDYRAMLPVAAVFVLCYTVLGGFLAESASDFMQAIVMVLTLVAVLALGISHAGGIAQVIAHAKALPGYLSAVQTHTESGASPYSGLSILSMLAWGLGYFGMPQVLLRFMSIRSEKELRRSRRIATVWVMISMAAAVSIGVVGRSLLHYSSQTAAESCFMDTATAFLPPILAGFACAGILAASVSSSDSYLLISASALSQNLFRGVFRKDATERQVMQVSRLTLIGMTGIACLIARNTQSTVFGITSFAWAGFGAAFGPVMLFSLFWKRTTKEGAAAGMLVGAGTVFLWKLALQPLGRIFGIYELLPAFLAASAAIILVSLLTPAPEKAVLEEFEAVSRG